MKVSSEHKTETVTCRLEERKRGRGQIKSGLGRPRERFGLYIMQDGEL